ncbi:MAG TPA: hypothetical protein VK272_14135 [Solirubrobacteraceae bacterium]|nr:hypothetical protein [Solirubrobacteraceae bacterium]
MSITSNRRRRRMPLLIVSAGLACLAAVDSAPVAGRELTSARAAQASNPASGGSGTSGERGSSGAPIASATLQQCVTSLSQSERSASFAGEMTAIPGTVRMQMRIGVLERVPGEPQFHAVSAPGLDVWRGSASGVKIYTYIKQVTNLAAPAVYRGVVRFRWLDARGHPLKTQELRTARCQQPSTPPMAGAAPAPPATGSAPTSTADTTTAPVG